MKITAIETIQLDPHPYLIFVQIKTDEGFTGVSDTYYATDAVAAFIHQTAAPVLLGKDPFQVERHWNELYVHHMARGVGIGAEMRALSALDTAPWDIRGQALGVPVYQLLGGLAQETVRTYNTCSGPNYGLRGFNRQGEGDHHLDDLWAQVNAPARLAEDLLSEGITAMKIWPFDRFALAGDGRGISADDLDRGLEPFRKIRDAVGGQIDIMLEGHGYWDLATAKKIAGAVEEFQPAWLEDLMLAHDIEAIAELKESTTSPVIASELLSTRYQYRPLMERRAADLIMIDPTWAGGITESRKIVVLAEAFGLSVAMHDCTGPFTLLAGVHLALSAPNVTYQETVRAYLRGWYSELTTEGIEVRDGRILPPEGPGLGAQLRPDVLERSDAKIVTSRLDN